MPLITPFKSSSTQLAAIFALLMVFGGIIYGYDMFADIAERPELITGYFKVVTIIFLIVCLGLFIISHYVTKRINSIVATAEKIRSTGDLSQRIPIDSKWDDLSKLSLTLNSMLDDIEQAVHGIRVVSDNIAHDLRTPLTRLRNRMEEMRAAPPSAELCHESMGELIRECDALLGTFQALLRISNIENGKRYTNSKKVCVATVLNDVTELYEALAMDKGLTFRTDIGEHAMVGDKDLLFQLFANLCDNAIKYTPAGGTVTLSTQACEHLDGICISVCDTGPGIPDDKKQQVFRRFFRLDSSRSTPGTGLGLSLVCAVVHMHKGKITLTDNDPHGLCVQVRLPR